MYALYNQIPTGTVNNKRAWLYLEFPNFYSLNSRWILVKTVFFEIHSLPFIVDNF